MSNRIQAQATKLWQTIAAPETASTYRNVLTVTWIIVQEAAFLFWLVLCLGLVFVDWFWRFGYQSGSKLRTWMTTMEEPDPNRVFSSTSESLITVGKTGVVKALNAAKAQLGMEVADPIPAPIPAHPVSPPSVTNTPTTPEAPPNFDQTDTASPAPAEE